MVLGSFDGAQDLLTVAQHLMACEHVALERDMLSGRRLLDHRVSQDSLQGEPEQGSTSAPIATAQDKPLWAAAHNSVVIATRALEELKHKRLAQMVCTHAQPAKKSHSDQNAELRGCEAHSGLAATTRARRCDGAHGGDHQHSEQPSGLATVWIPWCLEWHWP
jgi:hypothetical protein